MKLFDLPTPNGVMTHRLRTTALEGCSSSLLTCWLVFLCLVQSTLSFPQAELLRKTLLNKSSQSEKGEGKEPGDGHTGTRGLQTVRNTLL